MTLKADSTSGPCAKLGSAEESNVVRGVQIYLPHDGTFFTTSAWHPCMPAPETAKLVMLIDS